jgi:twitching motility protein PilT
VERIIGSFPASDQQIIRTRLAGAFRYFIAQRLIPQKSGGRHRGARGTEVDDADARVHRAGREGRQDAPRCDQGRALDGMQSFDGEIERLVREGVMTMSTAMLYATNPGNLAVQLADFTRTRSSR